LDCAEIVLKNIQKDEKYWIGWQKKPPEENPLAAFQTRG
jgi:hypothetical protein